ncbi:hypothetical protein L917_04537 [Phytophthora nicotianae]|nr:hypothetical protein L917_04537 [Phytophthora nicotianae]
MGDAAGIRSEFRSLTFVSLTRMTETWMTNTSVAQDYPRAVSHMDSPAAVRAEICWKHCSD